MAITINKQPTGTSPVNNDLISIVISDKINEANFSYIADLYINGADANTRFRVPPDPTYGVGVFNPANEIASYIYNTFDINTDGIEACSGGIISGQLRFGEEYGLDSSGTTAYPSLALSNSTIFFNGVFDAMDFDDFDSSLYRSQNITKLFLTNKPESVKLFTNEKDFIYAINRVNDDIRFITITTIDPQGFPLGSYKIRNYFSDVTTAEHRMVRCPIGWNLNDIPQSEITTAASFPVIHSGVGSFQIHAEDNSSNITLRIREVSLDTHCGKYNKYRIYFLNKLGGYDAYSFDKKNSFTSQINRESYKKETKFLTGAATYSESSENRGRTDYITTIEDSITINSSYITSGDVVWLEELVTSPDVKIELNGKAIPCQVLNSSFEKMTEDKKLYSLRLDLKVSYNRKRQRA